MKVKLVGRLTNFIILFLLLLAAASHSGRILGSKIDDILKPKEKQEVFQIPDKQYLAKYDIKESDLVNIAKAVWSVQNNKKIKTIFNTKAYGEKYIGYAGPINMFVFVDYSNQIDSCVIFENDETPAFLNRVLKKGILNQWNGLDLMKLESFKPDVLSGATMSSSAINQSLIETIQKTRHFVNHTAQIQKESNTGGFSFQFKHIIGLLVLILGLIISFFANKNGKYRLVLLVLNTLVLGFWCGSFISIGNILGFLENGVRFSSLNLAFLILIVSVVLPLFFNKKSYYCTWVCPFGSAQELAGKITKRKLKIPASVQKVLKHSKTVVTLIVLALLWTGVASEIVDYEPFSAFLFQNASVIVLSIAVISIVCSVFIPKPWCRYACPTGKIMDWMSKF